MGNKLVVQVKGSFTLLINAIARRHFWGVIIALATISTAANAAQMLQGYRSPALRVPQALNRLPATNRLNLAIGLPLRNGATLSNLLEQIYNPASSNYRHYLTPTEFTKEFGPTEQDYQAVIAFAKANHLQITGTHPNRMLLDVSGSVAEVETAFHTTFYEYQHPVEQRQFYAPDSMPTLNLSVPILQISGLDNYALPHPHLQAIRLAAGQKALPNAGSGPSGTYLGMDFRAAYAPDTSLNGSGQVVGLLQFDGYTPSDITYYENLAGLPNVPLQNVLLDGFSGAPTYSGGEVEVSLDIEMAISMAPNLTKVVVYEAGPRGNWHDILNRMANDNLARQLSCSWYIPGGIADPLADQIFQQMAAQGQTFFTASGDGDAYPGLIDFPGDSPYITQVGGTTLTTSGPGGQWVSETVWNWGDGVGSGGGISTQYTIPNWQTNINMTANQGSTVMRNTPDVSMIADHVYVRADGLDYNVGGTSCAAPLWTGFAALANQQAASVGQAAIGFINPALDVIGSSENYTGTFHDITVGNNVWSGSSGKFYATSGYDLCSGWGTPNGQSLIDALANPEPLLITPTGGFIGIGGVGGPFSITSQDYSLTNIGTNTLTWTLSNTSSWIMVSANTGTLQPHAPANTVTASLDNVASNLAIGTYNSTIWITNQNDKVGQSRKFTLSVISPPSIVLQPTNQAVPEGAVVTFKAQAIGGLPLMYEWKRNGTNLTDDENISGTSTTNLTIGNVSSADVGTYSVTVTNFAGTAISSNVALTIVPSPPIITDQPTNQTVYAGDPAQFSVKAIGTTPLSYQWSMDGTNLVDATNASLTFLHAQLDQSGNYSVEVKNIYGSTNSAAAILNVVPPPPCAPVDSAIAAWWPGESNALDIVGNNNGTLINGTSFTNGEVNSAFNLNGINNFVLVNPATNSSLDVGQGSGLTFEEWINPNTVSAEEILFEYERTLGSGNGSDVGIGMAIHSAYPGGILYANLTDVNGGVHIFVSPTNLLTAGMWQHIAVTYDKSSGLARLYVNGAEVTTTNIGSFTPQTSFANLVFGARTTFNSVSSPGAVYSGKMDEISLYDRALSSGEIAAIYEASFDGKCFTPMPPLITSEPSDQTVATGAKATFNVSANGTPPLHYQWSFDGSQIGDATNASLSLTNVQPGESGNYSVQITNPYGSTNSETAVLTVTPPPPCDPVPSGIAGWWAAESNVLDSVADNNGELMNGTGFATGEVGTAFQLNGFNNFLLINPSNATNLDIGTGSGLTFEGWIKPTTVAQEEVLFEYERALGTSSGSDVGIGLDIHSDSGGILYANLIDKLGNIHIITSPANLLTAGIWQHVAITYDRTSGTAVIFINGVPVANENFGSFVPETSFTNLLLGARTTFHSTENPGAVYSGELDEVSLYNRALSSAEIASIFQAGAMGKCSGPSVPIILAEPTNQTSVVGGTVEFAVETAGAPPLSYQWSFNGTNMVDATNTVLLLTNVQISQTGNYSVLVTNNFGSTNSVNAALTVYGLPPAITQQPTNETTTAGESVSLTVNADGTPPLYYQWKFGGELIGGATNLTLSLTNVQVNQSGDYSVLVTNLYGSTNSQVAVLTVTSPQPCLSTPPGIVGWWAAESNSLDSITENNGTLINGTNFTSGQVGTGFELNGVDNFLLINPANATNLDVGSGGGLTFEAWIKPAALNEEILFEYEQALGTGSGSDVGIGLDIHPDSGGVLYANLADTSGGVHIFTSPPNLLQIGTWQHVALTYDRTEGIGAFYLNGVRIATADLGSFTPQTSFTNLLLGARTTFNSVLHPGAAYSGGMDEISLYNRALTSNEIAAIYQAGAAGKCALAPTIFAQPTNQTVRINNGATFAVTAGGTPFLKYQWSFDGTNMVDATNAVLTLASVQPTNGGVYAVSVFNDYGMTNSSSARLTVQAAPIVSTQPTNLTVKVGETALLTAVVTGAAPMTYEWTLNGTNHPVTGATNTDLMITNAQLADAGVYALMVTNAYGSAVSTNATLTVIDVLDHFAWKPIASPRFANVPFAVTVQAMDSIDQLFTNYTGTVALTSTNGVLVNPRVSGGFAQGVWAGSLLVPQTVSNLTLQASDGAGHVGLANTISIAATPTLTLTSSGDFLLASWPVDLPGFVLETTTNLASATWFPVTTPTVQVGNQFLNVIQIGRTNQFYRLRYTLP